MKRALPIAIAALAVAALALFGLEGGAPQVELSGGPDGPTSRSFEIVVSASDARSGVGAVAATLDGGPLPVAGGPDGWVVPVDLRSVEDGDHVVTVTVRDRSLRRNEATAELRFASDVTPPTLTVGRSARAAAQGHTLAVWVRPSEPVQDVQVAFSGSSVAAVPVGEGDYVALFGVDVKTEPGELALSVSASDAAGNRGEATTRVRIDETAFAQGGFVQLTETQTAARQDRSAADAANDARRRAYSAEVPQRHYNSVFNVPVEGILTSPFGKVRTYSDGKTRHHLGTDLAAPTGTPVYASHSGVVTLTGDLHIYGNAVLIKHGPFASTSYNHLHTIAVEEGQTITRGDVLGTVGSTGQSTGPHLHWGMVVGGTAVAAEEWTRRRFDVVPPGEFELDPPTP